MDFVAAIGLRTASTLIFRCNELSAGRSERCVTDAFMVEYQRSLVERMRSPAPAGVRAATFSARLAGRDCRVTRRAPVDVAAAFIIVRSDGSAALSSGARTPKGAELAFGTQRRRSR